MSIPREFLCPITMDLMIDPVIGSDGHTYDRAAITEWFLTKNTSPLTNKPMSKKDLQPNYALRNAIERWSLTNEPVPPTVEPLLIPDTKSFIVTATEHLDKVCLNITTTTNKPMETILIAVLDVSGSMDYDATNNRQTEESNQFSRLDLVKHSMTTLATLLNSEYISIPSSLGIISFSNTATLIMPVTQMDQLGLNKATTAINSLKADGGTNIWDGLRLALLQAQTQINKNPNANIQILLLTDGEPTRDLLPPLGIQSTLKRKLAQINGRVTISTFGFGYNLDIPLLESICIQGNGTYGFIPDCSMVGTVFINWVSKALLTLAHHITIELEDSTTHSLGDIILGKLKTLVLPSYKRLEYVNISYDNGYNGNGYTSNCILDQVQVQESLTNETKDAIYLNRFTTLMEDVKKCEYSGNVNTQALLDFKHEIESDVNKTEFMCDIARDIESEDENEGQILKACSCNKWWQKWGRNHCIAYYYALRLQQCINFKDKALQHFASDAFKSLQEKGIDIFSELPAPIPSVRKMDYFVKQLNSFTSTSFAPNPTVPVSLFTSNTLLNAPNTIAPNPTVPVSLFTSNTNAPNPTVPVSLFTSNTLSTLTNPTADIRTFTFNMGQYVSNTGPCFTGDCKILMADGSVMCVEDLRRGNKVWGDHTVRAVLFTPIKKEVDMVLFDSGLKITPWHPMKLDYDGEWVFPNSCAPKHKIYVDAYYNLLLESGHTVNLNGYTVVTLGHGFTDNDVIKHPYFGTEEVINDLKNHMHWESGFMRMDPLKIMRCSKTGLISKM
jgi:uncharacterized protein YegL